MNTSRLILLLALLHVLSPGLVQAQVDDIIVSPDITVTLGGTLVADEDAAEDDLAGGVVVQNVGPIPANADLSAYHDTGGGVTLFSLDITVELPGPLESTVVATPSDVIAFHGGDYFVNFEGAQWGVPKGARIDAVTQLASGNLILSFDTTVMLSGTTFADEDLIEVFTVSRGGSLSFSMFFDGSAAGLSDAVDVDAAHYDEGSDRLYVSLDVGGRAGGESASGGIFADGFEQSNVITFSDEDLLLYEDGQWSVAYDGESEHAEWLAADLVAAFVTP